MASLSRSALIEALSAGRPEDLLGVAETSWVDFKRAPYALTTEKGKFELCKDVTAFANAQGGLLVLGVIAEKKPDQALEVATELRPFPQAQADVVQYVDTLNEYLRPRVAISHHWFHDPARGSADTDKYYLVIEVEPVPELTRYVVVRKMLSDKDRFVDGLAVPVRHGDRTVYLPSEDVYQLINEGVRARDAAPVVVPESPGRDWGEDLDRALDTLEQHQDWDEKPVLFWQSFPAQPAAGILPDLHSSGGIKGGLRNQDVLRPDGFNFQDSTGRLKTFDGGLYLGRTRCTVWVRPDGLVTAGAVATSEMLCWAVSESSWLQRLNVHVLTEMTLEYFRLADKLVVPRVPGRWQHRIVARRFAGDRPRGLGGRGFEALFSEISPASADSWAQSWPANGDPERDAYEALVRIYTLFGLDVSSNPDVDGNRVPEARIVGGT
ncbi:AlbA family DNA-binding domain-containing protein [Streptomyces umbrinus]|uniref:AlbA family DNA-binding domain-containing protein n=1 Tax=Streptomyces umbrinus TaxID=67370 RepID=UPI0033CDCD5B